MSRREEKRASLKDEKTEDTQIKLSFVESLQAILIISIYLFMDAVERVEHFFEKFKKPGKTHRPIQPVNRESSVQKVPQLSVIPESLVHHVPQQYVVDVTYAMPKEMEVLEEEFSKDGVSKLLCGDYVWLKHNTCVAVDDAPKKLTMMMEGLAKETSSTDAISKMVARGYRPATHIEAYCFAKTFPDIQLYSDYIALGSSVYYDEFKEKCVAKLTCEYPNRTFKATTIPEKWDEYDEFLWVKI